jgi:hypothetical protein
MVAATSAYQATGVIFDVPTADFGLSDLCPQKSEVRRASPYSSLSQVDR